jgi:hypothetical protein
MLEQYLLWSRTAVRPQKKAWWLYDSGDGEKICPAYAGSLRKSAAREL